MDKISNQLELYNGIKIPAMGFGVWQIAPIHTSKCVKMAIGTGYRNIDTAEGYMNEKGVGEGVRQAMDEYGLRREDIFVSTKLWNDNRGYDKAMKAFEVSLKKLGLEYLDLYLIHWPAVSRWHDDWREINRSTWRAFEELYRDGRIKAIGVSNFLAHHVQALIEDGDIKPMVNQIEYHPGFGQVKSAEYCQANGIVVEAWSPLGSGGVLKNGELNRIAKNTIKVRRRFVSGGCCRKISFRSRNLPMKNTSWKMRMYLILLFQKKIWHPLTGSLTAGE